MAGWSTAIMAGSSLLGGLGGLFGGGGGGGPTRTTTNSSTNWNNTNTNSPWIGTQSYLMGPAAGEAGPPGVYPEAARLYGAGGWTPLQQAQASSWFGDTTNNRDQWGAGGGGNIATQMMTGAFDPSITAGAPVAPNLISPGRATPVAGRELQGELDPTNALKGFLTGESTNPWVEKQGQAITDSLTRNMKENIFPGIRHNAIADGQYGGSRGDMAEGLAISRLNADLAPALTQLGGQAYEAEQGRKYGVATDLNRQGGDMLTGNIDRTFRGDQVNAGNLLDAQKFNTGTTLNNNEQVMREAAQKVGTRSAALDFAGGNQALTDQTYGDLLKALGLSTDYGWGNLDRYNAVVSPVSQFQTTNGAGTSNTSGVTTGTGSGATGGGIAGAIGGAAGGAALGRGLLGLGNSWFGGPSGPPSADRGWTW